jgi:peptidylprolyl isomerase
VKPSARPFRRPSARSAALVLTAGLLVTPALAACGNSSPKSSASGSASGSSASSGVKVQGAFGQKPTLTVPSGTAPTKLSSEVLSQGNGPAVASGQTIVVNYLGQTWEPKDGKPNVFDNSFDRKQPVNFPIGKGQVISGWDKTLVGQKVGSRVIVAIPPKDGYGKTGQPSAGIKGTDTLYFVVDILGAA